MLTNEPYFESRSGTRTVHTLLAVPSFAKGEGIRALKEIAFMLAAKSESAEIKCALSSIAKLRSAGDSLTLQIQLVAQFLEHDQQQLVASSAGELIDKLMPHVRRMAGDDETAAKRKCGHRAAVSEILCEREQHPSRKMPIA